MINEFIHITHLDYYRSYSITKLSHNEIYLNHNSNLIYRDIECTDLIEDEIELAYIKERLNTFLIRKEEDLEREKIRISNLK